MDVRNGAALGGGFMKKTGFCEVAPGGQFLNVFVLSAPGGGRRTSEKVNWGG